MAVVSNRPPTRPAGLKPEAPVAPPVEAPAAEAVQVKVMKDSKASAKPYIILVNGLAVARYRTEDEVRKNLSRFRK